MAIYKGNKKVVAVYKGSTPINKIYKGGTLVFQKGGGGGSTHLFEGTATGNFNLRINDSKDIPITPDADGKWFYDTDEKITTLFNSFKDVSAVTSVDLSNLDLTDISTRYMFDGDSNITSIKFNNTKSMKLKNVDFMFRGCSSLVSLDLSNWNTSSITSVESLFAGCSSLVSLDLSNWNTGSLTKASSLFAGCSSLVSLDLSLFDISNISKPWFLSKMFENCTSLSTIKCTQAFKDKCVSSSTITGLTNYETINWEIVG